MNKRAPIKYSPTELKFVKENSTLTRAQLTVKFNSKFNRKLTVSNLASLCKRNGWLTGRTGQYEKGDIPWCAGKKGLLKANKTSFKKGDKAHNHKPVGSQRVNVDGYIEIKISEPNVWDLGSRVAYRKHFGEIPKGAVISHKDGDRLNIQPDNLISYSMAENLFINQNKLQHVPSELKGTVKNLATLNVAMHKRINQ